MLFQLLRGGNFLTLFAYVCSMAFVVFCTMPVHEFAHAWTANKLGDQTPRLSGRLTLRPMAHVDIFGALMILLVGFGWAKPVPVNPRNFKNSKSGMAITAAAGPIANLIMAFLFALLRNMSLLFHGTVSTVLAAFFMYAEMVNVQLAVFNLLPVPPLDGSRLWTALLPDRYYYKMLQYERYIVLAVMLLLVLGILSRPLGWLSSWVMFAIDKIVGLPFQLIG